MYSARRRLYPWAAALPKKFSASCATLWGLGSLNAPGTWGSAAGVAFYAALFAGMGLGRYIVFSVLLAYISVGICDCAERFLKMRDPGCIVLDEFCAIPFCFLPVFHSEYSAWGILLGFALFRFFDISKPLFINKMQDFEGGLGCVADDVAAALVSCACLNLFGLALPVVFA